MVTINIYGLDQYSVSKYASYHTAEIANICESNARDVIFIATENSVFHNGVEQNTWNVVVHVHLPHEMKAIQKVLASYLLETLGEISIHVFIEFYYYEHGNHYERINKKYPVHIVNIDEVKKEVSDEELFAEKEIEDLEDECEDEECDCDHHHHHYEDEEDEDEEELIDNDIFLGNAFDGID